MADTDGDQSNASITALTGGGWVVSWQSPSGTSGSLEIHHQLFDSSGEPIGEAQSNTVTAGDQFDPMVVALSDGGWMETWTSDDGSETTIYRRRYDADGNTSGTDVYVDGVGGGSAVKLDDPSYVPLTDGKWVGSFVSDRDGGSDVFLADIFSSSGTYSGSATIFVDGEITSSDIVALNDGNFVVAWSTTVDSVPVSYAQIFNSSGSPVSEQLTLADGQSADHVRLVALDDGSFAVTFTLHGNDDDIYQQIISPNDPPVTTDTSATLNEDGSHTFKASDFSFTDSDGDTFAYLKITSLPDTGALKLNGDALESGQEIAASDIGNLVWTPDANENGTDSLKFEVKDSASNLSSEQTFTFNITALQDAPLAASSTITLAEDGSHTFQASDFGFSDTADGDTLGSVTITTPPANGTLMLDDTAVTANQVIDAEDLGDLVWKPAAGHHGDGLASLGFKVTDSAGTVSDSTYTLTFDVTSVADAPIAASSTISVDEDGSHTFAAADFGFSDVDGDTLTSIQITTLPASGTLTLNGNTVTANQVITAEEISQLIWTPAANAHGDSLASLGFTVEDSSGSSSESSYTISFDVASVNDLPTSADKTVTLDEDSVYSFTAADFAFSDVESETLSSITIVALPGSGTLTLGGEAVTTDEVITAADISQLKWTPAANGNGEDLASLQFKVTDADGGSSSATYSIHFDVDGVNDAPVAVDDTASGKEGRNVTVDVLANDIDVDSDQLDVTAASVTSGAGTVSINDAGKLVVAYNGADLDPGATYTVTVQYSVSDGTAEDTGSLAVTFTGVAEEPGDDIIGTPNPDKLKGTNVGELIQALGDDDNVKAQDGNDTVYGGDGNDTISGGDGDDILNGMVGKDNIHGDNGNDMLRGADGNDTIHGDTGKDDIRGGAGNDKLFGGADADTFTFLHKDGRDAVMDFQATGKGHDVINLQAFDGLDYKTVKSMMEQDGKDVVIDLPTSTEITLHHVHLADLGKSDFAF